MKIAIIKYNAGNVQSVRYALQRIGIEPILTDDHEEIRSADKVILPGVGNAATAMKYLKDRQLDTIIRSLTQPVLGICLGLQLLCKRTMEGNTECMKIFDASVSLFESDKQQGKEQHYKVPQVGWNTIYDCATDLFQAIPEQSYIYNVHSYYAEICGHTIAKTDYIATYSAALQKDNFYAVQFHAEKSGAIGEKILSNFIAL